MRKTLKSADEDISRFFVDICFLKHCFVFAYFKENILQICSFVLEKHLKENQEMLSKEKLN